MPGVGKVSTLPVGRQSLPAGRPRRLTFLDRAFTRVSAIGCTGHALEGCVLDTGPVRKETYGCAHAQALGWAKLPSGRLFPFLAPHPEPSPGVGAAIRHEQVAIERSTESNDIRGILEVQVRPRMDLLLGAAGRGKVGAVWCCAAEGIAQSSLQQSHRTWFSPGSKRTSWICPPTPGLPTGRLPRTGMEGGDARPPLSSPPPASCHCNPTHAIGRF